MQHAGSNLNAAVDPQTGTWRRWIPGMTGANDFGQNPFSGPSLQQCGIPPGRSGLANPMPGKAHNGIEAVSALGVQCIAASSGGPGEKNLTASMNISQQQNSAR